MTTPRETLTRYRPSKMYPNTMLQDGFGDWVLLADVDARDQAREAAIRELLPDARRQYEHLTDSADGVAPLIEDLFDYLEAMLTTPPQERTLEPSESAAEARMKSLGFMPPQEREPRSS